MESDSVEKQGKATNKATNKPHYGCLGLA